MPWAVFEFRETIWYGLWFSQHPQMRKDHSQQRRQALSWLLQSSALLGEAASGTDAGVPQWVSTSEIAVKQPAKLRTLTRGTGWAREEEPWDHCVVVAVIRKPALARQTWRALQESRCPVCVYKAGRPVEIWVTPSCGLQWWVGRVSGSLGVGWEWEEECRKYMYHHVTVDKEPERSLRSRQITAHAPETVSFQPTHVFLPYNLTRGTICTKFNQGSLH